MILRPSQARIQGQLSHVDPCDFLFLLPAAVPLEVVVLIKGLNATVAEGYAGDGPTLRVDGGESIQLCNVFFCQNDRGPAVMLPGAAAGPRPSPAQATIAALAVDPAWEGCFLWAGRYYFALSFPLPVISQTLILPLVLPVPPCCQRCWRSRSTGMLQRELRLIAWRLLLANWPAAPWWWRHGPPAMDNLAGRELGLLGYWPFPRAGVTGTQDRVKRLVRGAHRGWPPP